MLDIPARDNGIYLVHLRNPVFLPENVSQQGYDGWIVAEEESDEARRDGIAAIRRNRSYLRSIGW